MATQNPIEYEGTYPLPEAQLDRFLLKIKMGYPTKEEEIEVLNRAEKSVPIDDLFPVLTIEQLNDLREQAKQVHVENNIKEYIVSIAQHTRHHENVYLGVSPRASIALMRAAQSYAFMKGRDYVIPDDVQYLVKFVFGHRIILKPETRYEGITEEQVIESVLRYVHVPVKRYVP